MVAGSLETVVHVTRLDPVVAQSAALLREGELRARDRRERQRQKEGKNGPAVEAYVMVMAEAEAARATRATRGVEKCILKS